MLPHPVRELAPPHHNPDPPDAVASLPVRLRPWSRLLRRVRLFPPSCHPVIARRALLLWLYPVLILPLLLVDPSGGGPAWWAMLVLSIGGLVALAARHRRASDGRPRSTLFGVVNAVLMGASLMAALWCVASPYRPLFVYVGLAYTMAGIYPRVQTRTGTLVTTVAMYAALLVVVGWSYLALPPARAVHLGDTAVLFWALGLVAASTRQVVVLERERENLQQYIATNAHTDALTGLANRSTFIAAAAKAVAAAATDGPPCSLVLLDLDGLKDINDSFGHPVGDAAIRYFGACLRACAAPTDLVARLGGDEFAVLAVHRPGDTEATIVARFAATLAGVTFRDVSSGCTLLLSAAWGMATAAPPARTGDLAALLAIADERLLQQKSTPISARARTSSPEGMALYVPRGRRALAEVLASILEMTRDVTEAVDGEQFLRRAATRSAELIGAESCAVAMVRGEERWGYRATRSATGWVYAPAQFPGQHSIYSHVMETGKGYFSNDLKRDPFVDREAASRIGAFNVLCVPMRGRGGQVIGTVFLTNKLGRAPFTEHDAIVVQAFADLAVTGLEKTEALAAARDEAALSKALLRAVALVHDTAGPDEVVARIVREVMTLIEAEIGAVVLVEADGGLRVISFRRDGFPVFPIPPLRVEEGIVGHVVRTGRSYLCNDLASDPITAREHDARTGLRSQLSVPVHGQGGAVRAVICLFNAAGSAGFTTRHRELLEAFAQHIAIVLDRAHALRHTSDAA